MEESCLGSAGRGMEVAHAGVEGRLHGRGKLPASPWAELEDKASSVLLPHVRTPPFKCREGANGSCPCNRQNNLHRIAVTVSRRLRAGGGAPSQPHVLKWARNQKRQSR